VENKYFPYLVGLSAFLIAGSAAFFSVFGISKLFSGAVLAVIIMAGSLEIGKLVGASFLYRYWNKISLWLKIYMTVGVITLVGITSAGIFGYLSNAYQGATIEFEKQSTTLLYKEDRLVQLEEDKVYLKDELEQSIASLPDNYITAKRKLREDYSPKVLSINDKILDIKQEISDLKVGLVETGVDVGPAIYLARSFETDIDTVVKFFIFILIFVFDPMAIALVISFNVIIQDRNKSVNKDDSLSSYSDIPIIRSTYKSAEKKGKKVIRRWAQHGEKKVKNLKNKEIFKANEDSQRNQLERNWTKDGNK
jgi:hypothetical protein|tara:strand:+ start:405 stop:1328 length:924 start_codon:yes stop_codon:yes gene_type:complete